MVTNVTFCEEMGDTEALSRFKVALSSVKFLSVEDGGCASLHTAQPWEL